MDLIDEPDLAVFVDAEFIFGIDEEETVLGGDFLAMFEQLYRVGACNVPFFKGKPTFGEYFLWRNGAVMVFFLGGRGEKEFFQDLVFGQAFGEVIATKFSGTFFVGCPEGCAGGAGDVTADDKLDGKDFALTGKCDVGIRDGKDVVGDEVLCVFKPPSAGKVEHCTLERDGCKDTVERALAVGRDEEHFVAEVIAVANFSTVFFTTWQSSLGQTVLKVGADEAFVVVRGVDLSHEFAGFYKVELILFLASIANIVAASGVFASTVRCPILRPGRASCLP